VALPGAGFPPHTDPQSDWSLPAWTYEDRTFFELEKSRVFASSWQIVCHVSDLPEPGSYHTLDFLGDSVVVVRGEDQVVRGFANVCRHRGSKLVDGPSGCALRLTCPYHAWSYDLEGRLAGVPLGETYTTLPRDKLGLKPVDVEVWRGFVFIRLQSHGPSVSGMMAPYEDLVEPYRFEDLKALGRVTLRPRAVNWKNIGDNYSDGLHIRVAHPGLTRLFGRSYGVEASPWVDRMWGDLMERPSTNLSERAYQTFLPEVPHLPATAQKRWLYFKLWPNVAFDIYPDQVDFMQWLPVSPTECIIREISYVLPDDRREMRAARYLNWRINRQVNAEDTVLVQRVQEGMASTQFDIGPLSRDEVCLRSFAARLRRLIPECRFDTPPPPGWGRLSRPSVEPVA
jgi:phenylpropionate dioxygenase-like ring-hydroxylating dioxygenase large terminal subunit